MPKKLECSSRVLKIRINKPFHTGVCLQRPEEQSLKKCPKVSSAPTLCYFFVSSELSPLYQRAALVFLFCLSARYEPDALALFLALSLLRCLAMSCAVRAVVRCPALLLSALSLQLLCSALLCASCAVHCFRAFALFLLCTWALFALHCCALLSLCGCYVFPCVCAGSLPDMTRSLSFPAPLRSLIAVLLYLL